MRPLTDGQRLSKDDNVLQKSCAWAGFVNLFPRSNGIIVWNRLVAMAQVNAIQLLANGGDVSVLVNLHAQ